MKLDVAAKWSAALRSGNYAQDTGTLSSIAADGERKFCCLGVLCELAVDEGVIPAAKRGTAHEFVYGGPGPSESSTATLPRRVREWAGVDDADPLLPLGGWDHWAPCTEVNDSHEVTFEQIADMVDAYPEEIR